MSKKNKKNAHNYISGNYAQPNNTVLVACKIVNGLVISIGSREVLLNGPDRLPETHEILPGSYGLTRVDQNFWEEWVKDKDQYAPIKNKSVFSAMTGRDLSSKGKEFSKIMTGMEKKSPSYFETKHKPLPGIKI